MFNRLTCLLGLAALALAAAHAPADGPQRKQLKPSKEFTGSVADEGLMKQAPSVITSAKELEALWKSWGLESKAPEVDFTKDLVVSAVTRGSRLRLMANLEDGGNLQVGGLSTRDLRPGFRYVLAVVSREGVKKVNGKALPGS
jgi:hypothetical protein